jgi:hypothetical protein
MELFHHRLMTFSVPTAVLPSITDCHISANTEITMRSFDWTEGKETQRSHFIFIESRNSILSLTRTPLKSWSREAISIFE